MAFLKAFEVIDALEKREYRKALQLTRENRQHKEGFICFSNDANGCLESSFEYRYRGIFKKGFTLLHYAMVYGQMEMAQVLMEAAADIFACDGTGATPLHYACMFRGRDFIKTILDLLAKEQCKKLLNHTSNHGWTCLYYAAERRDKDIIELVLDKGADPTTRHKDDRNALHFAARFCSLECLEALLSPSFKDKFKMDIDVRDKDGLTPLHIACEENLPSIVKALMNKGADTTAADKNDRIPIQVATEFGAEECVLLLLKCPRMLQEHVSPLLQKAVETFNKPAIVLGILSKFNQIFCMKASTLLHSIVRSEAYSDEQFKEAVTRFGKHNIECEDEEKRTPIQLAAALNQHKKLSILLNVYIRILKENFYFPNKEHHKPLYQALIDKQDANGDCPIHLAVKCNGPDAEFEETVKVLEKLRSHPAIIEAKVVDKEHDPLTSVGKFKMQTAMHLALEDGRHDRTLIILELSKSRGIASVDSTKSTIIHTAIKNKISTVYFRKMLKLITESEADLNVLKRVFNCKNDENKTVLHIALELMLHPHARLLIELEKGSPNDSLSNGTDQCDGSEDNYIVDLNVEDGRGRNALHIAIQNNCPADIIERLIHRCRGCDPGKYDEDGKVPLQLNTNTELMSIRPYVDSEHEKVREVLRGTSTVDGNGPLDDAIEAKRTDIIELLLIRGVAVPPSTLKKVIITMENEEFAYLITRHAEDIITPLTQTVEKDNDVTVVLFHELIRKMPAVAKEALNRSWQTTGSRDESLQYDDRLLKKTCVVDQEKSTEFHVEAQDIRQVVHSTKPKKLPNPLQLMVEYKRLELLQHPVVFNVLKSKWYGLGLFLYLVQLLAYFTFIIPLSILVLAVRQPTDPLCIGTTHPVTNASTLASASVNRGLAGLIVVLVLLYFILMLYEMVHTFVCIRRKNTRLWDVLLPLNSNLISLLQVLVFLLSFVYAVSVLVYGGDQCPSEWQWHFGLFAIILGWTYLILLSYKLPWIGEYAKTFATIVLTFLKLAFFAILLILASTIILRMVFFDPTALQSPFIEFGSSIVKLLTTVAGELEYQDFFGLSYEPQESSDAVLYSNRNIVFPNTTNLVWILFLIIIPILLSNMLTGLAVGDVKEIQDNASLNKLALQVQWIIDIEKHTRIKTRNSSLYDIGSGLRNFAEFLWNGKDADENEQLLKEQLKSYNKKRESEQKDIEARCSDNANRGDAKTAENVLNVEKIVLDNEKKIKDFKAVHDKTLKKLREENAASSKELLTEISKLQTQLRS